MCTGLLLPCRWPLSYNQWWECEFITEGIIDNGERSPLPPWGSPLGFLVLGGSLVHRSLWQGAHAVPAALWEAAPLCTRGVVPASPLGPQHCPTERGWLGQILRLSVRPRACEALTRICLHCRRRFSGQLVGRVGGAVSQLRRCPCAPALLRAHLQPGLAPHCLPVLAPVGHLAESGAFWGVSPVLMLAGLLAREAVLVPRWWRSPGGVQRAGEAGGRVMEREAGKRDRAGLVAYMSVGPKPLSCRVTAAATPGTCTSPTPPARTSPSTSGLGS